MRVNKTLTLPPHVARRLEQEDNQSEVVRKALQDYWDGETDE